jgi:uncharacterized protein (DUF697 family)
MRDETQKKQLEQLIEQYAYAATGGMIAIPFPIIDLAAVFATWAKMVQAIGKQYQRELSLNDAKKLAWTFARTGISAGGAWFGSAAVAQTLLKLLPLGGRLGAYLLDATIAGAAMGSLTRSLAKAAQTHFEREAEQKEPEKTGADQILGQAISAGTAVVSIIQGIRGK